jgi:diguanylate cyclase (GGDEF)-like protein
VTGGWSVLAELQLVLAGFALLLAAQQASVWHWEGPRSSARLMVSTALATSAVFVTNDAVLRALHSPRRLDVLLLIRAVALAGLALSTLPLAASVTGRTPPRWLALSIAALAAARLALWPWTDLIYAHRVVAGVPAYGPLMMPTSLAVIGLVFGYLCLSAGRGRTERERTLLGLGLLASLVLAVVTDVSGDPIAAEVLTGYVPFPALVSLAALLWTRQLNAFRTVRGLAEKQHRDKDELHRRATTDELTGLANRSAIRDVIDHALMTGDGRTSTVVVALCDIDRFRNVNDVHGHPAGDEVLKELARRLTSVARHGDVIGRFGGDEFVVVCTDARADDDIEAFGRRLTAAFERPFLTAHVDASVTASIGIVTAGAGACSSVDADTLLRDADTAMYDAKARGGAVIGQFHDGLRTAVVYRADLEQRLTGALERGEIVVHYQPILSLPERRIIGFEALARWQQGAALIPTEQWIPIAESTALIHEIGEHVLERSVEQLQRWLAAGHRVGISVNVSPRQLSSRRFPDAVRRSLAGGVDPQLLSLEVTESMAVDEHAAGILRQLRRAGVRVALDDFGTGYSALAAVSRLPIDVLKIDKSIVRRVNDRDGQGVLAAVLAMAGSLGLRTIAEGVETAAHESKLIELGCQHVQGFRYSPAVDAESAIRLLEQAEALPLQSCATQP